MTKTIKPQILRYVKLLFQVAVLVVPLIFYINVKQHYEFPKTTAARYLLIPAIIGFFFAFSGRMGKAKNPFRLPILLLLVAASLSALRSVNLCETLDSKYLTDIFLYALMAHFIAAARFRLKDLHFYAFLLAVAGLISALYGIIQFYEAEEHFLRGPLRALAVKGERTEPVAFQGNRNYSSEFYNLALPMALAILFTCRRWPGRILAILSFLAMRYHLLIADTRATEVGLTFTIPIVLLILFWIRRQEWSRLVLLLIFYIPIEKALDASVAHSGFHGWPASEWIEILLVYFILPLLIYIGYYFAVPLLLHWMKIETAAVEKTPAELLRHWGGNILAGRVPGYAPPVAGAIPRTRKIQHLFLMAVITLGFVIVCIQGTYQITQAYHDYQIKDRIFRLGPPIYSSFFERWLGPRTLSYQAKNPDYVYDWRPTRPGPNADWEVPDFSKFIQDKIDQAFFWDRSITFRIEVYNSALAIARDNILLGIGVGNFKIVHDLYTSQLERFVLGKEVLARKVHDEYLTYSVVHGAFGLLALFWIQMVFIKVAYRIFRAARPEAREAFLKRQGSNRRLNLLFFITLGIFWGVGITWVSMVFGHSLTLPTSHFLVWASLGLMACLYREAFQPMRDEEAEDEPRRKEETCPGLIARLPGMQSVTHRIALAAVLSLVIVAPIFKQWMGESFLQYGMQLRNWIDFFKTQEGNARSLTPPEQQEYFQRCLRVFRQNAPHLSEGQFYSFPDTAQKLEDRLFNLFDKSIAVWPFHMETYYILGRYCIDFNRLEKGIEVLKQDLFMNPNYKWAHNNIGVLYDQTGEYHKARDVYYRALLIDPQQIFAHFNLAQGYLSKVRNIPMAIKHFYGVLDSNSHRLDVYGKLAWCLREEKRYDEAKKILDDYFYLRPLLNPKEEGYANEDFANYQLLIAIHRDLGQDEKALEVFEKLQRENPDSVGVRREHIRELIRQERLPEALQELKSLAFLTPNDANVQLQMAELCMAAPGAASEAESHLRKAIALGGKPIRVLAASRPLLAPLLERIGEQSE